MEKQGFICSSGRLRSGLALLALTSLALAGAPHRAEALSLQGTAGNALVRNTVSVAYSDAHNTAQTAVTASVDITVNTVAVAPTLFNFDASATTDGTGAQQLYHAWVRTNSNGPGTVSLTGADGSPSNMTVSLTTPSGLSSLYLGSTIFDPSGNAGIIGTAQTIANSASITVNVPNDQQRVNDSGGAGSTGSGSPVNALALNDIVYVTDGTTYYGPLTVTATMNNAVGTGATAATSTLTLTNKTGATLPSFTPAAGWQIVEAKQISFTVTQGVVTAPGTAASWTTTVTGTMGTFSGTGAVVTNAKAGAITVTKFVRNATTPVVGGGTTLTIDAGAGSQTYYTSNVNGKPTDTLEYLLVITNAGLGGATALIATDNVPAYTTLVTGSVYGTVGGGTVFAHAKLGASGTDMATAGTGLATVGFGGSTGTAAGSTMTFDLGTGSAWNTGGSLATAAVEYVIYRTTIN